jgi:hypothetical protein
LQKAPPTSKVEPRPADVNLEGLWKDLLERLAKAKPMLKSNLMEGRPLSLNADVLLIGFDPEFELHKEFVDTPKSKEMIQGALRELMHKAMGVRVVFADDPSIPVEGTESALSQQKTRPGFSVSPDDRKFEDDPLIQKALEIFKGQIVEIRR